MDRDLVRQAAVVAGVVAGLASGVTGDYGAAGESESLVLPADYAFTIWFPVYGGSLCYAWYQARPVLRRDPLLRRIGWPAALAYLTAGLWVRTDPTDDVWLTAAVMVATMAAAGTALVRLGPTEGAEAAERWFVRAPIGLFAGWITLATVANTTEALLANDVRALAGLPAPVWAVAALLVAGGIASATTLRTRASLAYPAAAAWGLLAAAVQQSPRSLAAGATAAAMAGLVAAAGWRSKRRPATRHPRGARAGALRIVPALR